VGLIVIVALYVLSIGPAVYLFEVSGGPEWLGETFGVIYAPITWMCPAPDHCGPLSDYVEWWSNLADP